jgi:hypothetical protein
MSQSFMWAVIAFCALWSISVTLVTGGILLRAARKLRDGRFEVEDSWRDQ